MLESSEQANSQDQCKQSVLTELLNNAQTYSQSSKYLELLNFVIKLRHIAPFNAMILHIQKPGIRYVASKKDWENKFRRELKPDARPLVILWPFAPVAFVYDVTDTLGENLPDTAFEDCFSTRGENMSECELKEFLRLLKMRHIETETVDTMQHLAGNIKVTRKEIDSKVIRNYRIQMNQNHSPSVRFATLIHELGHLYLGHLGEDATLKIKNRSNLTHNQKEIEAESLAYLVCARCGIYTNSESYLAGYVNEHPYIEAIDIHQIMNASGHVERALGLGGHIQMT